MRADIEVAAPLAMLMLQATEVCEGPREETHAPAVHRRHHMARLQRHCGAQRDPRQRGERVRLSGRHTHK